MTQQDRERIEGMEEQRREERLTQPSTQGDGRGNSAMQALTTWRPGLVTFAGAMMFVLGGFHVLLAISELFNSTWVVGLNSVLVIQSLIVWGIIDLVIGCIALYAAFSILRGGTFGWIIGYTFAALGVIRWLFYIPVTPVLAVVLIVLDVLVIYGLMTHSDYFQRS